jgi:hypothetical protein
MTLATTLHNGIDRKLHDGIQRLRGRTRESYDGMAAAIVEGSNWGWTSPSILGAFALAVVASVLLVVRSGRHPNPIIEPAVIRHRAVALADLSSLVFFAGFGAMVLGGVLFLTGVWHESVLQGIPRKVRVRRENVEAFVAERQAYVLAAGK